MARTTSTRSKKSRTPQAAIQPAANENLPVPSPEVAPSPAVEASASDAAVATSPSTLPMVTNEDVARRAYELFLARGGAHGSALEDWLQAERELQQLRN